MPGSVAASAAPKRSVFKLRPTLCLAAVSAACALTRPREAALITALDAHHEQWGELLKNLILCLVFLL